MRGIIAFCVAFTASTAMASGFNLESAKKRCGSDFSQSKVLYSEDLKWGVTKDEMTDKFAETYNSGKRLKFHSTYNAEEDQFYVYYKAANVAHPVKIGSRFIKSITQQIEESLKAGYADYVFFTDMGHSHLYFPQSHWDKEYDHLKIIQPAERVYFYEKALADKKMRPLYHTAEQLKMTEDKKVIDDEYLKFRYENRNVLGKNDGSGDLDLEYNLSVPGNAVSSIDGMHLYSAGFSISASKLGCFSYETPDGDILYFDISLTDVEGNPNNGGFF